MWTWVGIALNVEEMGDRSLDAVVPESPLEI